MKKALLAIKILIDVAMTVIFILLMGYHLFENLTHEWLGVSVFILFLAHNALNYRWYLNLFKGKYTAVRILQTTINILLWAFMLCNIASALMVSMNVFAFLGILGGMTGRRLHLLATIWTFILISFHFGLHWQMFMGLSKRIIKVKGTAAVVIKWIARVALIAIAAYGLVVFIQRELWNEMFLLVEFKFMDFDESPLKFIADYAALLVLFVAIGYYIKFGLQKLSARKKAKNKTNQIKED